jgi:hypothetical protein
MLEELMWIGVVGVVVNYIIERRAEAAVTKLGPSPRNMDEIDPSRWRHDGIQSLDYHDGNKGPWHSTVESELKSQIPN